MKKHYLPLSLFFLSFFANVQAQDYCQPAFQYNADGNMITRVQFSNVDQTSPFTSGTTPVYENFTTIIAQVNAGENYPISVKAPSSTFPSDIVVYIDFNQNGSFSDQGESFYIGRVGSANPANAETITHNIQIPATAIAGNTRMRILKNTNVLAYSNPDATNSISGPCATDLRSGQYEEYSVLILASTGCGEPGNNPGDLGCVTFNYRGEQKTLTTVRGGDGKIWLQQNLGSESVATSSSDETAFGDLFQWGRWDDGHQLRNSEVSNEVLIPNNPQGLNGGNSNFLVGTANWWKTGVISDKWDASAPATSDAENGCDPCKALGQEWSLPTVTDWTNIIASDEITTVQKAFESHLKLTAGGSRTSSGSFNFVGTRGYYWTKTTTTNAGYGKHFYYSSAIINANAGSYRELGMSIRCLKEGSTLGIGDYIKKSFKIYPNPTASSITIETDFGVKNIAVYNQLGQLISNQKNTQVDLSNVASGIYIIQIDFEDGKKAIQKIIKK